MSAISHFQRYSQRENHVTNNTLLMLRHVYRSSPRLLEDVLQALLEEDEVEIGPRFEQQVGAVYSIPDAVISQKPLHVYVEAKRGDGLYDDQLKRHMRSIAEKKHPENSAFLIGLTTNSTDEDDDERWKKKALENGITFAATTYRELLEALEVACSDDPELRQIFDDYQTFIGGESLLPDQHRKLVAMLCGQSWRENIAHGAYFEPAQRNPKWTRAHFLGIYRLKRISHVGRLVAAAVCRKENGDLIVEAEEFGSLSAEHRDRIRAIIGEAEVYFRGFASAPHRYYLVDRFAETDVRKVSSGGMMGHRYLDIAELGQTDELQQDVSSQDVGALLRGATYD
ncbi:PD-(D/E)XK nuclease family protein [Citreimonas salinaria]|uniref:PD-(D/E)XK nuclease superfamily protein n=1 Tax=Citreimonas salinaria TaxID=321339 RepID=A0A1H3IP10_9RHOB|nr:PD-(D/E)XK nuclease family protein [Citreimonas salinaria]SDY29573.1 PD-(D/E)XK nuclease superfamily protein [Citreimonas salinaria]